jgi:energy-coupling factor transporter ATP-binding protein EcfA2
MVTQSNHVNEPAKPDDFETWLGDRHKWLQTAARQMVDTKAHPTDAEISNLVALCKGEAGAPGEYSFSTVVAGSFVQASLGPNLRINGLQNVRGVNKIKEGAELSFGGQALTVVYGANGSGKTGFARVLKQACGSRMREEIHPNVFNQASPQCAATISITVDAKKRDVEWSLASGPLQELRHVHVFDSKVAANYLESHNEAHYAPSRMRFVSALIRCCDRVAERLSLEKQTLIKTLPQIPFEFAQTKAARWLTILRATTSQTSIEQACEYSKALDDQRIASEMALGQKDIAARLITLARERANVSRIAVTVESHKQRLSDQALQTLFAARLESVKKRTIASESAAIAFANAPLQGVGQDTWVALWEQARKFSESHAYVNQTFPNLSDGARCVLCQQLLDNEARSRIGHFEAFATNGLEVAAKAAEKRAADVLREFAALPSPEDWELQASALRFDQANAIALYDAITARRKAGEVAEDIGELPPLDWTPLDLALSSVSEQLADEEKVLRNLQEDGKRKELEREVLDLRARQWLNQNKVAISGEVDRLSRLALLDAAIALANTNVLTRKNSELARDELSKGYQKRFADELKNLGGNRLPVAPEGRQAGKGKVTFGLTLVGALRALGAGQVLSEGETRIVALAAFIADVTGSNNPTPFVFDDPISSLDQDFEEKVVKRLVDLSKSRQVIIFTHRLSLLALVESEIKKLKEAAALAKTDPIELHIESVCAFGKHSGVRQQISVRDLKPKAAINRLINEQVPQLRNLIEASDVMAYDARATGLCSDIRILVERCVESVLLNDVLVRFRRAVNTQGKIGALAKINLEDCNFIDDLMSRYSIFEHSQAEELPATRPDIDQIEEDATKLAAWIDEFSKRAAM